MNEINFGPNFNQGPPFQVQSTIKFSTRFSKPVHTNLRKHDSYGMESYFNEIKDIDDKINIATKPLTQLNTQNILTDTDLKIQNDIWEQSGFKIVNNLNSKNCIWKHINVKPKSLKHHLWQDLSASKMWSRLIESPASTKSSAKVQQKLFYKTKKFKNSTERKVVERKNNAGNSEDNIPISACGEPHAIPDSLEVKNLISDCKYKMSHLPLKLNASKIFVQQRNKSSKIKIQPNTLMHVDIKYFSKPNVVMTTVHNRQLKNQSSVLTKQYSNNNSFNEMNEIKHRETHNYFDFKYSENCYNAEHNNYLLSNELEAQGLIPNLNKNAADTWKNTDAADKISVPIKSATFNKIKSPVFVNKLGAKTTETEKPSLKPTNEEIMNQCSSKSIILEKLNEAIKYVKPKFMKIESLPKQKEQKEKNIIKSTRSPKTLSQIYGVGKIPFLIEVPQPGQSTLKQYLVVIELTENKDQESSENNTNSPLPLIFDKLFNNELLKETFVSPHVNQSKCCEAETIPKQTVITNTHVPNVRNTIGKAKNTFLPLLEINDDNKEFTPPLLRKFSQLNKPKMNEIVNKWTRKTYWQNRFKELKTSKKVDNPFVWYNKKHHETQTTKYTINEGKLKTSVRQYYTLNRKNQTTKILNYKLHPKVQHTNRTVELQQKRNLSCSLACPYCGRYPCVCGNSCTPCGWCPSYPCRPQCCPKFQLDYCCPRGRWDCSIPIPPCQKIEAPYPSYGECMPMWCKEYTECFDWDQHKLQPKNQVSTRINLMEESAPKVTVVDPALQRNCLRDKCCEPCYPPVDQRICCDCPHKVPVDNCCPRGRPHCYCWPDRPCTRNPPPYRCFSDEDLEFPEVEITENDLARKFASDLYRRMGRKCPLPFTPACSVDCDYRSGEPRPVAKCDPKAACATTCMPPGTYLANCTPVRTPPCQTPYDTCVNCCMPMEGIKKTRCLKRCYPQDNFGHSQQGPPACCPPQCCPASDCKPPECPPQTPSCPPNNNQNNK